MLCLFLTITGSSAIRTIIREWSYWHSQYLRLISFSHSHTECKTHKILHEIILLEFTTDYKTNKRFNGQWWRLQKNNHLPAYLLYIADIIIFLSRGSTVGRGFWWAQGEDSRVNYREEQTPSRRRVCLPFYARKVSRHYRPCPVFSFIGRRVCSYFIHLHYHLGMLSSAITSTGSDNQEVSQGLDSGRPASSSVVARFIAHAEPLHFVLCKCVASGQRVLASGGHRHPHHYLPR